MAHKKTALRITFYGLLVLATLIIVELLLRVGPVRPAFEHPFDLKFEVVLDREVLFKIKPHSSPEINNYGYRDRDFTLEKSGKKRVLFLGDSFIMGLTSTPDKTIPKELERILGPRYEVFNMGVYGYGPDQSLVQLREEVLAFKPDMVILSLFPSNDFDDNYKNRLFFMNKSGKLVESPRNAVTSTIPVLDTLYFIDYILFKFGIKAGYFTDLFTTLHHDAFDFDLYRGEGSDIFKEKTALMKGVLGEIAAELEKRNIPLLTLIIPYGPAFEQSIIREPIAYVPYYYEDLTEQILREEKMHALNLYKLLNAYTFKEPLFARDSGGEHLSAFGHKVAAGALYSYMNKEHLTPLSE